MKTTLYRMFRSMNKHHHPTMWERTKWKPSSTFPSNWQSNEKNDNPKSNDENYFQRRIQTNMLNASKKFYKINCLIIYIANKNAEKWAETYLYIPFPFAGDSRHGNFYENLLQISKVRAMHCELALSISLNSGIHLGVCLHTLGSIQYPNRLHSSLPCRDE